VHPLLLEHAGLSLEVRLYQVLFLLAIVVSLWIGPRWVEKLEGIEARRVRRALFVLAVPVLVGGRLHFIVNHWSLFAHRPLAALAFWSGGLHAGGALIALAIVAPLVLRRFGIPLARFADGFAPTLGLGVAVARLGCFAEGCCFGRVCAWPWCMRFPRATYIYDFHASQGLLPPGAEHTAPIHPLQLYFAGVGLLVMVLSLWLHPCRRYPGEVGLVALVVLSVGAAVLEPLRADAFPRAYWGPLPQLEWTALAMTAASLGLLAMAELSHRRARGG